MERFDYKTSKVLRHYVYILLAEDNQTILYVGQGRASRVTDHFRDARSAFVKDHNKLTNKQKRLLRCIDSDKELNWRLVAHNLPSQLSAEIVEAAVIDAARSSGNLELLNLNRGARANKYGGLSPSEVSALRAPPINPSLHCGPIFIFPIHRQMSLSGNHYEFTRRAWSVSDELRRHEGGVAIGVQHDGYAEEAYTIAEWQPDHEQGNLWKFARQANQAPDDLRDRNWNGVINLAKGYWQRGGYLVVEFDGRGRVRFMRGSIAYRNWVEIPRVTT